MKLLIILSTEECTRDIRKILARENTVLYSETKVRGCCFDENDEVTGLTSWLSNTNPAVYSRLFFVFQDGQSVEKTLSVIKHYNRMYGKDRPRPFYACQLDVKNQVSTGSPADAKGRR